MAFLGKEYTFYKHENFDGFLKFVGVPEDKIQPTLASVSKQTLVKNGDSYTSIITGAEGVKEVTFKCGVEFDDVLGLAKTPVKTTCSVDGNTVTQTIKAERGSTTFKKEYNGDELVVTITADGWDGVAKRYYKA